MEQQLRTQASVQTTNKENTNQTKNVIEVHADKINQLDNEIYALNQLTKNKEK